MSLVDIRFRRMQIIAELRQAHALFERSRADLHALDKKAKKEALFTLKQQLKTTKSEDKDALRQINLRIKAEIKVLKEQVRHGIITKDEYTSQTKATCFIIDSDTNEVYSFHQTKMHEINADKLRFQYNNLSYWLIMLGLVLTIIAMFILINVVYFKDAFYVEGGQNETAFPLYILVAVEILIGIISMLMTFMSAEKIKYHDRLFSRVISFIVAIINVVRIFMLPFYMLINGSKIYVTPFRPSGTASVTLPIIEEYGIINMLLPIILLAVAAFLYLIAGVIAAKKYQTLAAHLKELKETGKLHV